MSCITPSSSLLIPSHRFSHHVQKWDCHSLLLSFRFYLNKLNISMKLWNIFVNESLTVIASQFSRSLRVEIQKKNDLVRVRSIEHNSQTADKGIRTNGTFHELSGSLNSLWYSFIHLSNTVISVHSPLTAWWPQSTEIAPLASLAMPHSLMRAPYTVEFRLLCCWIGRC